ncbi:hypothetical protein KUCAC02_029475 [Chaenocephalus aceratus]|nr:hypothetical protein KUCAC02_029475 [Chaenocephalus aceratus]
MMKECLQRVKLEKKEPLVESQLFIMELARELNRICQRSSILSHVWTSEDVWPPAVCRDFIVEWAAVLEKRVKPRLIQIFAPRHAHPEQPRPGSGTPLCMLAAGGEGDMGPHKRGHHGLDPETIRQTPCGRGKRCSWFLDDLELQWKRGRLQNLLPAMELLILAEDVTKQWLVRKQRSQKTDAARYIPHNVWNWICDAAEEVKLDSDSANPDLLISSDKKRMRCGLEHRDVPRCQWRFNGWWCSVEVGQRDWRLGVAKASAVRQGYRSLTTDSGYLTLRLERGLDLKALTVPATHLTCIPLPRKVGVYLDYEQGQLSFYDVEKRSHLYTFNDTFTEELFPVFGTVEVVNDLVIRPADVRQPCLCTGPCLWT